MKRAYVLLLALLLILTGCTGEGKVKNVSVKDVCCPYAINHKKDVTEITLIDGEEKGILWDVETISEDICQVTQETVEKAYTTLYSLTGKEEGTAQLTFTAKQPDETVCFVLTLIVNVDANGKAVISSCEHQERIDNSVDADGLQYEWNIDTDGILNFVFINKEDGWIVNGDGGDVFELSNMMSTPSGCTFSAQPKTAGETTVVLTGSDTQRTIHVVIRADDSGNMEVVSVQEQ